MLAWPAMTRFWNINKLKSNFQERDLPLPLHFGGETLSLTWACAKTWVVNRHGERELHTFTAFWVKFLILVINITFPIPQTLTLVLDPKVRKTSSPHLSPKPWQNLLYFNEILSHLNKRNVLNTVLVDQSLLMQWSHHLRNLVNLCSTSSAADIYFLGHGDQKSNVQLVLQVTWYLGLDICYCSFVILWSNPGTP